MLVKPRTHSSYSLTGSYNCDILFLLTAMFVSLYGGKQIQVEKHTQQSNLHVLRQIYGEENVIRQQSPISMVLMYDAVKNTKYLQLAACVSPPRDVFGFPFDVELPHPLHHRLPDCLPRFYG